MANLKASKQGILTNERNRKRNVHFKTLMKTTIKRAKEAIQNKAKDADTLFNAAIKILDKLKSKGILHQNNASRRKSDLAKAFNKAGLTVKATPKKESAPKKAPAKKSEATEEKSVEATKKTVTKKAAPKKEATEKKAPAKKASAKKADADKTA